MSLTAVQVDPRPDTSPNSQPPLWWASLQLACLGFFIPLSRMSGSQRALTDPVSALIVGAGVTVVSILVYLALGRVNKSRWKALAWVSTGVLFFWQWGAWGTESMWLTWLGSLVVSVLVMLAVGKIAERRLFQRAVLAVTVTLALTMVTLIAVDTIGAAPSSFTPIALPELTDPTRTPDVVFIVLDAYAREDVLREDFAFDNGPFIHQLEESGFYVADSANANYTMTHFSIPSILSMGYLESPDAYIDNSDLVYLEAIASGSNPVVETLKADGYRYIHGSADNWLNHCSEAADLCLPGPPIDQTAFALLAKTPVGPLLYPESGDPTTSLNRTRIEQLLDWRSVTDSVGDDPTLTYLHLGLPHPPLFLDSSCEPRVDHNLSGQLINFLTMSPALVELRKAAYVEQLQCANSTVVAFLEQLEGDEIVVITSDHGPDSYGLLNADPLEWSDEQIHERLATLTAIRLPEECDSPDDPNLQLVNIFRIVFSCLYDTRDLPPLAPQYRATSFSGPVIRLENPDAVAP